MQNLVGKQNFVAAAANTLTHLKDGQCTGNGCSVRGNGITQAIRQSTLRTLDYLEMRGTVDQCAATTMCVNDERDRKNGSNLYCSYQYSFPVYTPPEPRCLCPFS